MIAALQRVAHVDIAPGAQRSRRTSEEKRAAMNAACKKHKDKVIENGFCASHNGVKPVPGQKRCQKCIDYYKRKNRESAQHVKELVVQQYGGVCACCTEAYLPFLSIHIEPVRGDRPLKGTPFYRWLRNNNYPPGYQVLCHNCNMVKRDNPFCTCPYKGGRK